MAQVNRSRGLPLRTDGELDLDVVFVLAEKHGLSYYDAAYPELATRHRAPVETLAEELARAAAAEGLSLVRSYVMQAVGERDSSG